MRYLDEMNDLEYIVVMSEGNPGALSVCTELLKKTREIDPEIPMGGIGAIAGLDAFGVYGSRIWCLYKDVCGQDISKLIAILRAVQLDIMNESKLNQAINAKSCGFTVKQFLDIEAVISLVQAELPQLKVSNYERSEKAGN